MSIKSLIRHGIICLVPLLFPTAGLAQSGTTGEVVYAKVAESIFLLQITDSTGQRVGTGSGFLIAPQLVITNAHVANAGNLAVQIGPASIDCVIERTDQANDLALCRVQAKITVPPLRLSDQEPQPGAVVFAIGNPQGLEKTITQGLFTGMRERDGVQMAQISAPISPGSSGGPILNGSGEVVGVAVSSLVRGQNLNFAVPLQAVRALVIGDFSSSADAAALLLRAKSIRKQQEDAEWSADPDSAWQKLNREVSDLLVRAVASTSDLAALSEIYSLAGSTLSDIQVAAARKSLSLAKTPTGQMYSDLARALYYFTDEVSSPEIMEAEKHAVRSVEMGKGASSGDLLLLGHIQSQQQRYPDAYASYQKAANVIRSGDADSLNLYLNLFDVARRLKRPTEAENWFMRAKKAGVGAFQLATFGEFLEEQQRYPDAAATYIEAFSMVPTAYSYVCSAGKAYWIANQADSALAAMRRCIELATPATNSDSAVLLAHRGIANILNARSVYDQALAHARDAIQINADDAWAHLELATALNGLRRFTEAITAAKNAVRLSDGKYATMHFELGSAYFELRQFANARQSFQQAAELNVKDAAAAYNVAVSYYNENFFGDALRWYREVLRRNPNYENRERILQMIETLSQR